MKRLAVAVLIAVSATGAQAGPDSDLLAKAGLLGAWAVNCNQPPSQENPYQIFAPSKTGYPTRNLKMVSSIDRTSEIRSIRLVASGQVKFLMKGSGDFDDRHLTVTVVGNRLRAMEAVDLQGKKYVTNGKINGTPNETPSFQKCGG